MIFTFEFENRPGRWSQVGVGKGEGIDALKAAFGDLVALANARLPYGRYRYRSPATDSRWRYLLLRPDNTLLA